MIIIGSAGLILLERNTFIKEAVITSLDNTFRLFMCVWVGVSVCVCEAILPQAKCISWPPPPPPTPYIPSPHTPRPIIKTAFHPTELLYIYRRETQVVKQLTGLINNLFILHWNFAAKISRNAKFDISSGEALVRKWANLVLFNKPHKRRTISIKKISTNPQNGNKLNIISSTNPMQRGTMSLNNMEEFLEELFTVQSQ